MAISVDTVYKTVLLILNKEQRGYMTPDEFNKTATQVQREIFEKYFEDLNQQVRIPQTDMEYSDRVAITDEKIAEFKVTGNATHTTNGIFTLPSDLYRLGSLTYSPQNTYPVELQRLGRADFYNINKSPLTRPTTEHPVYLYEDNKALVYPTSIAGEIEAQYVKKPRDVVWAYFIDDAAGGTGAYYFENSRTIPAGASGPYPATGYVDFELHNSEQTEVILNILMYAGVIIRNPQVIQAASAKIQQEEVNEKS